MVHRRTSAQNLHHLPAKPLSFSAASLHLSQLSPTNPIIVMNDILRPIVFCQAKSRARCTRRRVDLAPERYGDAHQGEHDTQS